MSKSAVSQKLEYDVLSKRVRAALRDAFGENTVIETEEGYQGRVRVKLVSPQLNGMSERQKQNYVWEILQSGLNGDTERVSFVLAYATEEL